MSKLSDLAWRRNGVFGRMSAFRNQLKNFEHETTLTKSERNQISEAVEIIEDVISEKKKKWSKWKITHKRLYRE